MMKKMFVVIVLMLASPQGFAASAWVEIEVTVLRASVDSNHVFVFFEPLEPGEDPSNCGDLDYASFPTTNDWKVVHSTVLAALLADKTLTVKFDGCQGTRPVITSVEIQK